MRLTIKKSLFFILFSLFQSTLFAQGLSSGAAGARASNPEFPQLLEWTVKEKGLESKLKGSPYIDDDWKAAKILFKNNQILEGLSVKYDLRKNLMEIQTEKIIRVCPSKRIIAFELNNEERIRQFVNCNQFKSEKKVDGFYEVLVDSEEGLKLLEKVDINIKKPNYNPALDVGDTDSTIIKKETLLIANGENVSKVPKNKKGLISLFEGKTSEVTLFIKKEKLKVNDEADLVRIVEYYNSIL